MLLNLEQNKRTNKISLTPLIDVVFILLLFFMLSSTFSKWHQLPLQTPTSSVTQTRDLAVLKIQSNQGEVMLNGDSININNPDELRAIVEQHAKETLVITAAQSITVQTIVNVMDALKQSGANRLSFAGTEQ